MQVILLKVPLLLCDEVERRLQGEGGQEPRCQVLRAAGLEHLPERLPPGLVILGDDGGALKEMVELCRRVHARRFSWRTHLTVLTRRSPVELQALARAGADECISPPGEDWGVRLIALSRRLHLDGMEAPALVRLEQPRVTAQEALYALLSSTSADIGPEFFRALVAHLVSAFRVTGALVGALTPDKEHLQLLAFWTDGGFRESRLLPLRGTPHQEAITHGSCHIPDALVERFPDDALLQEQGYRAYLGVALRDSHQQAVGVMAVAHGEPFEAGIMDYALLGALGTRAGAELARGRAQAELEHTRDFLSNIINAVPDPVFVKDREHRFVAMNAAFARFMARTEEQLIGKSDYDFVPEHEASIFWRKDEEVFRSGQPNENEETLTDSAGRSRTLITTKAAFTGAGGEQFIVAVIRDVTESRRLEMQLRLADRMASVGALAAGVAHEINNPLAYISSNLSFIAEQLAQDELEHEARTELRQAVLESLEGTRRVRGIVQDLKFFARADDEKQGAVDVHRVIHGALRIVRNEFQHRALLTRALEPVPAVHGSEGRLGQVVVNLLVNALQALPIDRPSEQNSVRIATHHKGAWVHIEVEDNGQGMSSEVQKRIFDPFFTTKPIGKGTGLGLSISNTLIQVMGGWIEVQSTQGKGSTFRLVLPVYQEKAAAPEPAPTPVAPPTQEPRRRVLLIDDEPAVGASVRRLLRGVHEVHTLQDAREALGLIARGERYDAILCDVMMQGMSGVQFVQELERVAPEMARRTGLMSGGVFDAQARSFIEARALDFLHKPFERESLRAFLERLYR
ncbi:hybrid sensor histidine kinase/response regulator [Hyalangium rubrum]|uniref:histidine kinase n=1 Tax=Hyalangium rubrum TaxID=3103134 RepID=A0ABU5H9Q0_9BACT|nr:ATP-binding protein [Hyalangium sp. s54d21]MDY7228835.1 ATP-binding protein [Hyalangium sp. s54d21]